MEIATRRLVLSILNLSGELGRAPVTRYRVLDREKRTEKRPVRPPEFSDASAARAGCYPRPGGDP